MSFMERRGGLTRFKTGFGIVIRVPSPMILSIDRWIDRSSYRVESSCNKLGKRGEINSRLDRINGIFARDCKVQFIRLSLSLSRACISKPNFIDAKSWPRNWFSRCQVCSIIARSNQRVQRLSSFHFRPSELISDGMPHASKRGGKNEKYHKGQQEHGTETKTARMLRLYCKLG